MAGYSHRTLLEKLGYQPDDSVYVVNGPDWFVRELGQHNIVVLPAIPATWAHGFFTSKAQLQTFLSQTDIEEIEKGMWISWPKKSSKMPTDLTEHDLHDHILPANWVDTKVAAIDETWSGFKFVRRKT